MHSSLIAMLLVPALAGAQSLTDAPTVLRILERFSSEHTETPLQCQVKPIPPALTFGFRFQAGYTFRIPMAQFSGPGHSLTVVTRIAPGDSLPPVFLMDTLRLPPVPPTDLEGVAGGGFFLGEGHYQVSWVLADDRGRTCHSDWPIAAELARGDRASKLLMPPNTVAALSLHSSPAAGRHPDSVAPMRLTVLLDVAPLAIGRSSLASSDQVFLYGALSALLDRIPATSVRLVAFNLEQQKELFRRDGFTLASLYRLAGTLNELQLAKVEYQTLQSPTGYLDLLARLINQELRAKPPSDAVIFLGPRERFHQNLPPAALDKNPSGTPRFFFLPYLAPGALPAQADSSSGSGVDDWRGGRGGRGIPNPGVDASSAPPPLLSGGSITDPNATRDIVPSAPAGLRDTVSLAVRQLKGKVIAIRTPAEFAKAIEQIERH
ncbi:MAG: hypothetical protein P4L56_19215 [Candidatus Sulfopaludibacter sp.]|nr:hypothetical protein [Candidatus Sulfopaludibacter sp.]